MLISVLSLAVELSSGSSFKNWLREGKSRLVDHQMLLAVADWSLITKQGKQQMGNQSGTRFRQVRNDKRP